MAEKTNADNGNYAGYLRFLTRSSGALPQERLRITSAGLVGINCTPLSQFQVKGGTNANIGLTIMSGEASVEAFNDAGTASVPLRLRGEDLNSTPVQQKDSYNSSGVVGINTDVSGNGSGAKLVVGGRIQSNAGGYWFVGANGAEDGWHVQDSGGNLVVVESGVAERLRISSAGNIGINDTDPRTV